MTFHEMYDPKTEEMIGKWLNHRILMGTKADMNAIKAILNERVQGEFEIVMKEERTDLVDSGAESMNLTGVD